MKRIFAVVVLMASMVAGSAQANTCGATVVDAAGAAYVAVDSPEQESVWIYEESNGIAGLQRDDSVCAAAEGQTSSDTIIF